MKRATPELAPRLRVDRDSRQLFGPGKAELLHYIAATGSIRAAAAEMDMSYQRAWNLVQQMNEVFSEPLVLVARGGGTGGGALPTPTGRKVLALYSEMEQACRTATHKPWVALRRLLK